jgi:hypothetical protein
MPLKNLSSNTPKGRERPRPLAFDAAHRLGGGAGDDAGLSVAQFGIVFPASRADDGPRQAWRRRIWKAVAVTLSRFLARE